MKKLFEIQTESGQLWVDIAAHLEAKDAEKAAAIAAKDAEIAAKAIEIETLKGNPPPPLSAASPTVLDQLHAAYSTELTEEQQVAFAPVYAIVRVLLEAGQPAMAASYIRDTPVPPELVEIRESLAALVETFSE